jgi:hypothetical protein
MTLTELERNLYASVREQDPSTLQSVTENLRGRLFKLDRWFDMFLDKFSSKLDEVDRNDPIKKMYNTKFDEYSKTKQLIVVAESYMKKNV